MRDLQKVEEVIAYFNDNCSTVRATANHFKISKSSVHLYLTQVLPNPASRKILDLNKSERHIRGGLATKNKYGRMQS